MPLFTQRLSNHGTPISFDVQAFEATTTSSGVDGSDRVDHSVVFNAPVFVHSIAQMLIGTVAIYSIQTLRGEISSFILSGHRALSNYKLAEFRASPFIIEKSDLRKRLLAAESTTTRNLDLECLASVLQALLEDAPAGDLKVRSELWRIPGASYHLDVLSEEALSDAVAAHAEMGSVGDDSDEIPPLEELFERTSL
ncbi:hypothetical protein SCHPADRAFT_947748 [Schizopora paradoxa]|uniref:Uncharacterized protein n=1 Tax=Schizopora paradoxa TaxID=27342 RepID=A0A0H2RHM0_9AGAM|nr:hypothetical protein SCHPADRAFT_947748 [Schizopora paradoxa]